MKCTSLWALAPLLLLAAAPLAAQSAVSPEIKAALADPGRPEQQVQRDAARHPGEMLALANVKPGMKVADFMMGAGYWTHILSPLVGPNGRVYGYQAKEFIDFRPAYGDEQKAAVAARSNITPLSMRLADLAFPEPLDMILTVQNYHDLYLPFDTPGVPSLVTKRLYDALKPGGVLLVSDHVAVNDPENKAPTTLHRIAPANARAEIEKAGFVFVRESDLLANKTDAHDKNVFDPAIMGKTDQWIMLFRKPG